MVHLIQGEGKKELVDIELSTGEVITATAGHPLYHVNDKAWVHAGKLSKADVLLNFNDNKTGIAEISRYTDIAQVYNLTVAEDHTYFVGVSGVLGHNAGLCKPLQVTNKSLEHLFKGNKTGGFHSRPGSINPSSAQVLKIIQKVTTGKWKGAYHALVKICPKLGKCFKKQSSFFPDKWSKSRVQSEINTAYLDALSKGKKSGLVLGRSATGGQIEMVIKPSGELVTAYPKFL